MELWTDFWQLHNIWSPLSEWSCRMEKQTVIFFLLRACEACGHVRLVGMWGLWACEACTLCMCEKVMLCQCFAPWKTISSCWEKVYVNLDWPDQVTLVISKRQTVRDMMTIKTEQWRITKFFSGMFEGLCVKEAHPAKPANRVVTKISNCWVNTTSRRGIKQPGISFGSIFQLMVAGDHTRRRWGKSLASSS